MAIGCPFDETRLTTPEHVRTGSEARGSILVKQ
jgi:hypothetical protein